MPIVNINSDKKYVTYLEKGSVLDKDWLFKNVGEYRLQRLDSVLQSKPKSAWWGSPIDAEYGWREYCESVDDFGYYDFNKPIIWSLKDNSKIFQIGLEDVTIITPENELLKYIYYKDWRDCSIDIKSGPLSELLKQGKDFGSYRSFNYILDFKSMYKDDIVAVELMDACIGHMFLNPIEEMFNSWDCESICVLDNNYINIIFEGEEFI